MRVWYIERELTMFERDMMSVRTRCKTSWTLSHISSMYKDVCELQLLFFSKMLAYKIMKLTRELVSSAGFSIAWSVKRFIARAKYLFMMKKKN